MKGNNQKRKKYITENLIKNKIPFKIKLNIGINLQ